MQSEHSINQTNPSIIRSIKSSQTQHEEFTIHVGTNDVWRVNQDFENLAKTIHSILPVSKIIFSGIVKRKQRNKDNTTINSKVVDAS